MGPVCALLFVSIFPPLIYQFSWQRVLSDVIGYEIAAAAVLSASLLFGLALGNLVGGALSKRLAPLPLIAGFAMASGAFALAALPIFAALGVLGGGSGLGTATILTALTLMTVSGLPVGAGLPLAVDALKSPRRLGPAVGRVIGMVNFGAAAACLACLVWFISFHPPNLPNAIFIAAAINAVVACSALLLHRQHQLSNMHSDAGVKGTAVGSRHSPILRFHALLSIAAAVGFVAWSYEAFFIRAVLYATQSSMTALVATLGAFLLGLACGAEQAGRRCLILTRDGAMGRALSSLMKASVCGTMFLPLVNHMAWFDRGVVGIAVVLIFVTGRFWGALLPYLAELGIAANASADKQVAWLAFAHHAGATCGAGATGFALAAGLGLAATASILVVAGLVCAAVLVWALAVPRWEKKLRASLAGALGLLAMAIIPFASANVLDRLREIGAGSAPIFSSDAESR